MIRWLSHGNITLFQSSPSWFFYASSSLGWVFSAPRLKPWPPWCTSSSPHSSSSSTCHPGWHWLLWNVTVKVELVCLNTPPTPGNVHLITDEQVFFVVFFFSVNASSFETIAVIYYRFSYVCVTLLNTLWQTSNMRCNIFAYFGKGMLI